jgi:hypothetical protein
MLVEMEHLDLTLAQEDLVVQVVLILVVAEAVLHHVDHVVVQVVLA